MDGARYWTVEVSMFFESAGIVSSIPSQRSTTLPFEQPAGDSFADDQRWHIGVCARYHWHD